MSTLRLHHHYTAQPGRLADVLRSWEKEALPGDETAGTFDVGIFVDDEGIITDDGIGNVEIAALPDLFKEMQAIINKQLNKDKETFEVINLDYFNPWLVEFETNDVKYTGEEDRGLLDI